MHPNEKILKKGYDAFAAGDMDTIDALFADDIVWHAPGNNPVAGTFKGKKEVFALFGKLFELSGGTFKVDVHALFADDEHGITLTNATGSRDGKTLNDHNVQVFHFKDGKITEQWLYYEDVPRNDAFWS